MNRSVARMNEKLAKFESKNYAPKVAIQQKSRHSYIVKPNSEGVQIHDDDNRSNLSPQFEICDPEVVYQEKVPGSNISNEKEPIPQGYMPNSYTQMNFSQGQELNPQG